MVRRRDRERVVVLVHICCLHLIGFLIFENPIFIFIFTMLESGSGKPKTY